MTLRTILTPALAGLAVSALALSSGCASTRLYHLSAVSTKPVHAQGVDLTALPKRERVDSGSDYCFLGIGAQVDKAVDRALNNGGGNLMLDGVVYVDEWPLGLFAGYRIVGTVVTVPGGETPAAAPQR